MLIQNYYKAGVIIIGPAYFFLLLLYSFIASNPYCDKFWVGKTEKEIDIGSERKIEEKNLRSQAYN